MRPSHVLRIPDREFTSTATLAHTPVRVLWRECMQLDWVAAGDLAVFLALQPPAAVNQLASW